MSKNYKIINYLSLAITGIYCFLNIWFCLSMFLGVFKNDILEIVLPIDGYTWHIYSIFALATLIYKIIATRKNGRSIFNKDVILHSSFTLVSLVIMYCLFFIVF